MRTINNSKKVKSDIRKIIKSNDEILIVHYSYANIPEQIEDLSSMITTIVVRSLNNRINECFGLHLEADLIGVSKSEIKDFYSDLELSMLEKFMAFVRSHNKSYWINWNMKDVSFGFQAIKHRYWKLTGRTNSGYSDIPTFRRINLDVLISDMFGENYSEESDKLLDLMTKNGYDTHSYLSSNEESIDFCNGNYNSVLDSVRTKVAAVAFLFEKLESNKIKIPHKNTYAKFIEIVTHPIMAFIGWIATITGLIIGIITLS